jgi:putative membrane protein
MKRIAALFLLLFTILSLVGLVINYLRWDYPGFITPLSTICGFFFCLIYGSETMGWKRILILSTTCVLVALIMESLGVATGWVYGPYHYSNLLGPKFLNLVPYIIPIAWFMMIYPSLIIAERLLKATKPGGWHLIKVAAVGGVIMTAWDLVMDPIMVEGGHWVWDGPIATRAYFGIPIQNFWGWWLTTFITLVIFLVIENNIGGRKSQNQIGRMPVILYAVTGISSILSAFNMGLGGPAIVGIFAMIPWVIFGSMRNSKPKVHGLKTTWF